MNAIKLNLVDYEVVKELRKIDGKLVIFGIALGALYLNSVRLEKQFKNLESYAKGLKDIVAESADDVDDIRRIYNAYKEKHKED